MSKIFRRSSCQKASDGTDGALRQSARGLPLAPEKTGTSMSRARSSQSGPQEKARGCQALSRLGRVPA